MKSLKLAGTERFEEINSWLTPVEQKQKSENKSTSSKSQESLVW